MVKRRYSYEGYWTRYEPTWPIAVEDGIRAKSQRGKFVKNWWADRWIEALKAVIDSARLSRGRSYARRGQVLDIDVAPGRVSSRVQGSRRAPYRVTIEIEPLTGAQWDVVLDALAGQAIYAAQLLNGEMPPDVEDAFKVVKVPLFPASKGDLNTECSCPDWANPCKHIAAVYYLLGERFDEDPFLLFELRGRSKEHIVEALRARRVAGAGEAPAAEAKGMVEAITAPPLDECLDTYWALGEPVARMTFEVKHPEPPFTVLKRAGVPAFDGIDAHTFRLQMQRVYDGVTAGALAAGFAEWDKGDAG